MILILISLFLFAGLFAFYPPKNPNFVFFLYLFFGAILIIFAGFRSESSMDYGNYVEYFNLQNSAIVEPSFLLISWLIHYFLGSKVIYLFVVFAILGVSIKLVAIKRLSPLLYLSVLIYISTYFILHEMIQMRAGVASAFLLLCVKPIYDRNWKLFLLYSTLAISFHYSAIIVLPLWFIGLKPRKVWMYLAVPVGYLIYFLGINLIVVLPIPGIQEKIEIYQKLQEIGDKSSTAINVFNFVFLAKVVIFYLLVFKYEVLALKSKFTPILMKTYCLSLFCYPALSALPAVATRVSDLLGIVSIVLIPMLFYVFKPMFFSRALIIFIGAVFLSVLLFYVKLV